MCVYSYRDIVQHLEHICVTYVCYAPLASVRGSLGGQMCSLLVVFPLTVLIWGALGSRSCCYLHLLPPTLGRGLGSRSCRYFWCFLLTLHIWGQAWEVDIVAISCASPHFAYLETGLRSRFCRYLLCFRPPCISWVKVILTYSGLWCQMLPDVLWLK